MTNKELVKRLMAFQEDARVYITIEIPGSVAWMLAEIEGADCLGNQDHQEAIVLEAEDLDDFPSPIGRQCRDDLDEKAVDTIFHPEIPRELLGLIVDKCFAGAVEDCAVIEDIYRVIAAELNAGKYQDYRGEKE
jgi:hypothetical protein